MLPPWMVGLQVAGILMRLGLAPQLRPSELHDYIANHNLPMRTPSISEAQASHAPPATPEPTSLPPPPTYIPHTPMI
jgi:hypothetical protein